LPVPPGRAGLGAFGQGFIRLATRRAGCSCSAVGASPARPAVQGGQSGRTCFLYSLLGSQNRFVRFLRRYFHVPFAGWTATALSVGTEGTVHLLWNKTDGTVSFWNVDFMGAITFTVYGPYPGGWKAVACSTDPQDISHILWSRPDSLVSLWNVDSVTGNFSFRLYGPLTGYVPTALSSGP